MPESAAGLDTLELWEKGVWWANAHVFFAPKEQKRRYNGLDAKFRTKPMLVVRALTAFNVPPGTAGLEGVDPKEVAEWDGLRTAMRDNLLRWMREGKLVAYGYAFPRRPDDKPHAVSLDLWRFHPSDDGRLEGDGLRFDAIRVLHPSWIEAATAAKPSTPPPAPPKPGRPSKADLIGQAFEALNATGAFAKVSQRQAYPMIQRWIEESRPDEYEAGVGLQQAAIRSALGARLRDACKPASVRKQ